MTPNIRRTIVLTLTAFSLNGVAAAVGAAESGDRDRATVTPIKHVLVIFGENRTFDHVFATYQPRGKDTVWNLVSRGIITADGAPGPSFALATQRQAVDTAADGYQLSPGGKTPYAVLPAPLAGGPTQPYLTDLNAARQVERALPDDYVTLLTTGGTGLPPGIPDTRLPNVQALPPQPYPLTPALHSDDYAANPAHRFYQMWQQLDCSVAAATPANPSGCRGDLFAWVEATVGSGTSGKAVPSPQPVKEGATALGFYNIAAGDAPYLKQLADEYALSDNYHQAVIGGSGPNHIALATADMLWFSDGKGTALTPPARQIENPNAQPGTNNAYAQDGSWGGSYSACADPTQPGVGPILKYLAAIHIASNCEPGHHYLLNNQAPGYYGDGSVNHWEFAVPPSDVRSIGDALLAAGISWRYYGDQWNRYVHDPAGTDPADDYCNICNPFQYSTSIMANDAVRTAHLKDTLDLDADLDAGWLPAFAIIKPSGLVDGHPASSKVDLFEGFTKKIVDAVKSHPDLWKETAIFVTFDEGGGYYDSGYVQPLDFFGDGTRTPLLVVSPLAAAGHISHQYADHVSILKFVERNWRLKPLTPRSRDNLPNPVASAANPYVPRNSPAIDDLFDLFTFGRRAPDAAAPGG